MKSLLTTVGFALATQMAQAGILGVFDFNDPANRDQPSWVSPCIELCPIGPCDCLGVDIGLGGGPDGSDYRIYSNWDVTQYDPAVYFDRNDVWQWPRTVAFNATAGDDSLGTISGLSVDVQRPGAGSPDSIMASIFWKDDLGTVQYRSSGPVSLVNIGSWETINFDFVNGTADLPSGLDYAGEEFLIELYAWGGSGGALYMDNVTLTGECAPIPEPGGALLIASSGLVLLLRRRRMA
jgi:hypothetical protein